MIPSRPLDLGGIIGESIRIVRQTYWQAVLLYLIFILSGSIFIHFGLHGVIDGTEKFAQKYSQVSPEAPALVRDYLLGGMNRTTTISIYRLEFPELFRVIDSVNTSVTIKYPDSSRSIIISRLDSIANVVSKQTGTSVRDLILTNIGMGLILLILGLLFLIFGSAGASAALYDLSSRAFEERPVFLGPIIKLSLTRSLWLLLVQYVLIFLGMTTGLALVVGITSIISPILVVLGVFVSVMLVIYAGMRILFSGIALVSEGLGPFEAIKRSLELTTALFWRVFGISIIVSFFIYIVSVIIQTLLSVVISPDLKWLIEFVKGNPDLAQLFSGLKSDMLRLECVFIISLALTAGFFPSFLATLYYDLRTRKDGPLEYPEKLTGENFGAESDQSVPL